jgi:PiT family inorganic phosphate transporter
LLTGTLWLLVLAGTLFLAYANGANDNFKGVATLYGSGLVGYRTALLWATATTFLGSLAAAVLAQELIDVFTGKGLVPAALVGEPTFVLAVVVGAALTVFVSALLGIPVSTTHALTGALLGAGLAAVGSDIGLPVLWRKFFIPLAVGPLIPVALLGVLYPATARAVRLLPLGPGGDGLAGRLATAFAGDAKACHAARSRSIADDRRSGAARGGALNAAHVLSAGAVSFARGLNDTPKIVAIMLTAMAADIRLSILLVATAMAAGGLLHAWRVACTMGCRITPMSHGQGALANLITSAVVIGAAVMGLPASTTHVSCGALFGLGAVTRRLNWRLTGGLVSAWLVTLPAAGAIAAAAYLLAAAPA